MKEIGIVGGLGPEATVDYYKEIINAYKENGELNYPEIILISVNMSNFLALMDYKKFDEATTYLVDRIKRLHYAGADFAAITANTPHQVFDQVQAKSPIPLISIIEVTCDEAQKKGFKRCGLLGTAFTMNATFYSDVFRKRGIEVIMPCDDDKQIIHQKLFTEIELGIFRDDTRQILIEIIERMVKTNQIDSLILGCTELPLILTETSYVGIPILNTTKIHVKSIVDYCNSDL